MGVIENNVDPRREGRVQVRAFGIHGTNAEIPTDELPWAMVVQGGYNPNAIPRLNSWCFGVFVDGRDCQQPMVLGMIPRQTTEPVIPTEHGYGVIPTGPNARALAQGSTPEDFGLPQNSRLLRGENIHETYVLQQEMGRTVDIPVGGTDVTWSEPPAAFNTEYPLNHVIETANHSIELDDTNGSERIMIRHRSGSYVQIDSRGSLTTKSTGDRFDINDRRQHVVVGGLSTVTIYGDSHVQVMGNKTEEIMGDYQRLVHGNYMLSVGGQMNFNGGEQVQLRAADVKIQANVGTMSIHAAKELQTEAGIGWYAKAPFTWLEAESNLNIKTNNTNIFSTSEMNIRSNGNMNMQSNGDFNFKVENAFMESTGTFDIKSEELFIDGNSNLDLLGRSVLRVGSNGNIHIDGTTVYIDDNVSLANGSAQTAGGATNAGDAVVAEGSISAGQPEMPEPVSKAMDVSGTDVATGEGNANVSRYRGSGGASSSYTTPDHGGESGTGGGSTPAPRGEITAAMQTAVTPLLDFIGNIESDGYDDISGLVSTSRYPSRRLTEMTIQEVLDWQESIDQYQLSEASGRYQFMEDTLRGYNNDRSSGPGNPLYTQAGLSAGDLFSPINQDRMAIVLLRGAGLDRFLAGTMSREAFANRLAGIWAALPLVDGRNAGLSAHAGDSAGNEALTTVREFLNVLDQVRSRNESFVNNPQYDDAILRAAREQGATTTEEPVTNTTNTSRIAGPGGNGGV